MKKFLLLLLPIALVPTITACQDKAHSIVAINSHEPECVYVEINKSQFERLVDQKQSFLIEFYGNGCGHCADLAPKLENYIQDTGRTFYRFDLWAITSDEYYELVDKYGDQLMPDGVPTLSFVKEGELTYTVDANKHDSYTGLKKILNKHFISSNIEIVSTKAGFDSYCLKHSDYVAYSYDLSSNKSIELAAKDIIIESVASSKKNILLLNKDVFADSFDEIIAHYGVSTESFSIQVKNKEVKKTIDYQTDGDQLKDLISSL